MREWDCLDMGGGEAEGSGGGIGVGGKGIGAASGGEVKRDGGG